MLHLSQTPEKLPWKRRIFSDTSAVCCCNPVKSNSIHRSPAELREPLAKEFFPANHSRHACDRLRPLPQTTSVQKNLPNFRTIVLSIEDIHDGEKIDRFIKGLRYTGWIEVLKSQAKHFEDTFRMVINVDRTIWRAGGWNLRYDNNTDRIKTSFVGPTSMEIGNNHRKYESILGARREQRSRDIRSGSMLQKPQTRLQVLAVHTDRCK